MLQGNGVVVPPGDSAALRDALRQYLTDPLLLRRRSAAARSPASCSAAFDLGTRRRSGAGPTEPARLAHATQHARHQGCHAQDVEAQHQARLAEIGLGKQMSEHEGKRGA